MGAWPLTASTVQHPIRRCCSHRQDTSRAQTCGQSQTPRPEQRRARQAAIKKTSAIHVTSLLHRKKEKNCGFIVLKARTHQHVLTAKRNECFQKGRDKINRQYELRNKLYFCKFILVALKTSRLIMFRHKPPNCTE